MISPLSSIGTIPFYIYHPHLFTIFAHPGDPGVSQEHLAAKSAPKEKTGDTTESWPPAAARKWNDKTHDTMTCG